MSAEPIGGRRVLAAALARAEAWLLEPVAATGAPELAPGGPKPVVTVFGLARGCGASVVARALATELAARDRGAAVVGCAEAGGGLPLAQGAAARLARDLADVPGARTRASGRLCLVAGTAEPALAEVARHHAPLVLDAGASAVGGAPAAVADRVVLVAVPRLEPSLAIAAAACLLRMDREPVVVLNRAEPGVWDGEPVLALPDSRMAAQLALAGREPRGAFGDVIAELADLCEVRT